MAMTERLRLSDDEAAFYQAVANRLPPQQRPLFRERVAALTERGDPGPGSINRAVRIALRELQQAPLHWSGPRPRWSR
jgi:hypothetical protein